MEQNPQNVIMDIPNPRKRKHGPMHAIRVLFMMRGHRRNSKLFHVHDGSKSMWIKFVGHMRVLHLHNNQSLHHPKSSDQPFPYTVLSPSPPFGDEGDGAIADASKGDEGNKAITYASNFLVEESNLHSPPISRYASAVGLNELVSGDDDNEKRSRYASAVGLNEVAESDEDNENLKEIIMEEEEECEENGDGDEMIDAKADEFIAEFYKQMRLQSLDVVGHHYKERSQRSLGG
ncbi:hypothetical protein Lal_00020814 [Lupinus albus]|uniref:Uncharacterized protein n=1 Tax=Lupinus albus TaxID=3870 RepID=A0A6A4Q565_LUPAL|nr:hypothetical protein Lalb_Chr08g0237891 [Lupinus albus]KAF1871080.1 hypothetical protein Lal_00020814 [Lupinus albus]